MDEFGIKCIVDLCTQPADGHIDHIAVAVEIHVPDQRRDQRTWQDLALVACQQLKERELFAGQIDALAGARRPASWYIQNQVSNLNSVRLTTRAAASQQRATRANNSENANGLTR